MKKKNRLFHIWETQCPTKAFSPCALILLCPWRRHHMIHMISILIKSLGRIMSSLQRNISSHVVLNCSKPSLRFGPTFPQHSAITKPPALGVEFFKLYLSFSTSRWQCQIYLGPKTPPKQNKTLQSFKTGTKFYNMPNRNIRNNINSITD